MIPGDKRPRGGEEGLTPGAGFQGGEGGVKRDRL